MPTTLNISLEEEQKLWLNTRKEEGGFSSTSDVVRSMIREAQRREQEALTGQFRQLDQDGSDEAEPEASVLAIVQEVKRERRG